MKPEELGTSPHGRSVQAVYRTRQIDHAMGERACPSKEQSPACVDPPSRYMLVGEDSAEDEWENITTDKMFAYGLWSSEEDH